MPLRVLSGPGCDRLAKLDYVQEIGLGPDDVVISVGSIFDALSGSDTVLPSSRPAVLRTAVRLRDEAIREANSRQLGGYVLTSNGNREALDALNLFASGVIDSPAVASGVDAAAVAAAAGVGGVLVLRMTQAEACAQISALVPRGARRAACEQGIKDRWFGRYEKAASDIEVAV